MLRALKERAREWKAVAGSGVAVLFVCLLLIPTLFLTPASPAQVPADIGRILQKIMQGQEPTPEEQKRIDQWEKSLSKAAPPAAKQQQDEVLRTWMIEASGSLGYQCKERDSDRVTESSKTFDISFMTTDNGVNMEEPVGDWQYLGMRPGPLVYKSDYVKGRGSSKWRIVHSNGSEQSEDCDGTVAGLQGVLFVVGLPNHPLTNAENLPKPVPLTQEEQLPEPVPLVREEKLPKPVPLTKPAQPASAKGVSYEGRGLISMSMDQNCKHVTRDSQGTHSYQNQFRDSVDFPVKVHIQGNTVTIGMVRCDDADKMKAELHAEKRFVSEGTVGTCSLFPGPRASCQISGTLTGNLTRGKVIDPREEGGEKTGKGESPTRKGEGARTGTKPVKP
ncbi:MAG: hypothetical protein LAO06_00665 [Acidobacteriia bacterium]|nr:hypothetical protein [Terriglobia bacterium]